MTSTESRRNNPQNRGLAKGITVLELLAVIATLGLMLCAGVMGLRTFQLRAEAINGVRCVTAAMQTARYRAIGDNRRIRLVQEGGGLELEVYKSGEWSTEQRIPMPEGVELRMNARPVFYPEGHVVPLCSAYVTIGRYRRRISISMAGRIKVTTLP